MHDHNRPSAEEADRLLRAIRADRSCPKPQLTAGQKAIAEREGVDPEQVRNVLAFQRQARFQLARMFNLRKSERKQPVLDRRPDRGSPRRLAVRSHRSRRLVSNRSPGGGGSDAGPEPPPAVAGFLIGGAA